MSRIKAPEITSEMVECLKSMRSRLSEEKNWTTFVYSRNKSGVPVSSDNKDAQCWCISGALFLEANKLNKPVEFISTISTLLNSRIDMDVLKSRLDRAKRKINAIDHNILAIFNDVSNHKEILQFLDEVIESL
jgi:hypothetical protein